MGFQRTLKTCSKPWNVVTLIWGTGRALLFWLGVILIVGLILLVFQKRRAAQSITRSTC